MTWRSTLPKDYVRSWDRLTTEAGIAGASIEDPAAHDRVARFRAGKLDDMFAPTAPPVPEPTEAEPPAGTYIAQMLDLMSQRVAGGNRVSASELINDSASLAGASSLNTSALEATAPQLTTEAEGTSVVAEGSEVSDTPFASGGVSVHTYNTNAQRLADQDYQQIARQTVTPIGEWLESNFGVSVAQDRPLNVRPSGGAEFSDHYWGGALDVTGSWEQMNAVAAWARENITKLGVDYVLWQQPNHYDHVHISWLAPESPGAVRSASDIPFLGLEQETKPLAPRMKTQSEVGADVGAYTKPRNVI